MADQFQVKQAEEAGTSQEEFPKKDAKYTDSGAGTETGLHRRTVRQADARTKYTDNSVTYELLSEMGFDSETGVYLTYGVRAVDRQGNLLKSISDITTDKAFLAERIECFNRLQLSLCHLEDVIEDLL